MVVIRYGGEFLFYLPGVLAKRISLILTGSTKGVVTTIFFYLVAAVFVLGIAGLGYSVLLVDKWLSRKRDRLPGPSER